MNTKSLTKRSFERSIFMITLLLLVAIPVTAVFAGLICSVKCRPQALMIRRRHWQPMGNPQHTLQAVTCSCVDRKANVPIRQVEKLNTSSITNYDFLHSRWY